MYYWVNQGKTFKEEHKGGYLWAPKKDNGGKTPYHWNTMNNLKHNDVVFNYAKGFIIGYCSVISEPYDAPKPKEFDVDVDWEDDGVMIDVNYLAFNEKISIETFYNECKNILPEKYSPVNYTSDLRANQGYLYELSGPIGESILKLANEELFLRDIKVSEEREIVGETTKESTVKARLGQAEFRRKLLHRWKNRCAVTGCGLTSILIASHIVPWRDATDKERWDIDNGLPLAPTYDALFDKHLISFDANGRIIISSDLDKQDLKALGLTGKEIILGLTDSNKMYLKKHSSRLI